MELGPQTFIFIFIPDRQKCFLLIALNKKKGKQRQTLLELFVSIFWQLYVYYSLAVTIIDA